MPAKAERFNAHIGNVKVVKQHPNTDAAMSLLRQCANIVSPLLERKKWKIGVLTEFYPSDQCLHGLNINRGQTIKVRLRCPSR